MTEKCTCEEALKALRKARESLNKCPVHGAKDGEK